MKARPLTTVFESSVATDRGQTRKSWNPERPSPSPRPGVHTTTPKQSRRLAGVTSDTPAPSPGGTPSRWHTGSLAPLRVAATGAGLGLGAAGRALAGRALAGSSVTMARPPGRTRDSNSESAAPKRDINTVPSAWNQSCPGISKLCPKPRVFVIVSLPRRVAVAEYCYVTSSDIRPGRASGRGPSGRSESTGRARPEGHSFRAEPQARFPAAGWEARCSGSRTSDSQDIAAHRRGRAAAAEITRRSHPVSLLSACPHWQPGGRRSESRARGRQHLHGSRPAGRAAARQSVTVCVGARGWGT